MEKLSFAQLIFIQAKKYGEKTALYDRENVGDEWTKLSWSAMANQVSTLAKALIELGVSEQQRVAQFSQNKAENLIVDFALFANRAVMVPMYATSSVSR
jgi:long-chain acyl-CoA synthetase